MRPSDWHLNRATQTLITGGVIAYPTEAVWGLGCDPWNAAAVDRMLKLKQRPMYKGLILIASQWGQFQPLLEALTAQQIEQLNLTWPGPTTWLIPDPQCWVPPWIKGQHANVALRVSAHPIVTALCDRFNGPIVSTSANLTGLQPIRSRLHIARTFGDQLDYVVNGELGQSKQPSQVKDLVSGQVIRPA